MKQEQPRLRQLLLSMPMGLSFVQEKVPGDILSQQVGPNRRQYFRHLVGDFNLFSFVTGNQTIAVCDLSWGGLGLGESRDNLKGVPYSPKFTGILRILGRFSHFDMDVRFSTKGFSGCQFIRQYSYGWHFLHTFLTMMDSGVSLLKYENDSFAWPDGWELYRGKNIFLGLHLVDDQPIGGCLVYGMENQRRFCMINQGFLDYGSDLRTGLDDAGSCEVLRQSLFILMGFYQRMKHSCIIGWVNAIIEELQKFAESGSE